MAHEDSEKLGSVLEADQSLVRPQLGDARGAERQPESPAEAAGIVQTV